MGTASVQIHEIETPDPGLYPDVPHAVYRGWRAASQTVLKIMRDRSPAHALEYMLHPPEPTPALLLGAAVHTAVLQPDLFRQLYARAPEADRRTKAGREAWEAVEAEHPEATILRPEEYDLCIAIRDSVYAHPAARKLLRGQTEVSAVWRDPWHGVLCKGRFDVIPDGLGVIADMKTARDASPGAFSRTVYANGLYIQGAMYLMGGRALGLDVDLFAIVAVEKEPPYAVAVYNVRGEALAAGEEELGRLLETWARCMETGNWPGYPDKAVDITLPPWAWRQVEERVESA